MTALKLLVLFLVSALSVDMKSTLKKELNEALMLLDDTQSSMKMASTWGMELNGTLGDNQLINTARPQDLIPYQFWVAAHARGEEDGQGLEAGLEYVTFKSKHGKFLSLGDWAGNHPMNDRTHNGGWEKFTVEVVGYNRDRTGLEVAFRGWNGKYMSCQANGNFRINRDRLGSWEKFEVFTTSTCRSMGLAPGENCLALRSVVHNKFLHAESDGDVFCNRRRPASYEKWFGWTDPEPWRVLSIEFDLEAGTTESMPPITIDTINCVNLNSSTPSDCSRTVSQGIGQTESYENNVEVGITVGTTFETGVPLVANGQVSMELSVGYNHAWGTEIYNTTDYVQNIPCVAPPGRLKICRYSAGKSRLDVPYTMVVGQAGGWEENITGTWYGVSTHAASTYINEYTTCPEFLDCAAYTEGG